jgi:WD40 repeat protein
MLRSVSRVCVVAVAGAALAAPVVTGTGVSAAAARGSRAAASPGTQLWVKRYDGPADRLDAASSVAVSPAGGRVFVTGTSYARNAEGDYATVAYSATTGARLWIRRYNDPANGFDDATALAVSPTGKTVFVTGESFGGSSGYDYVTVAYNAVSGARLWVSRYSGHGNGEDGASSVAVGPGGRTVFVTGTSMGASSAEDYATVAYDAATGARRWVARYNGPGNQLDRAVSLAVGRGGGQVFVTGTSAGSGSGQDYATIAYDAATGARRWVSRYNGPGNGQDSASSVAVSHDGGTVFVTGASDGLTSGQDYATVAYSAATGKLLWTARYQGVGGIDDAWSVAVSPSGLTVFVTGTSENDYATVAYSAASGAQLWARRYSGPSNLANFAAAVAVSPNGAKVFVTGLSVAAASGDDYATVAYDAATGARLWVRRYDGPGNGQDDASSLAVSPDGRTVFVTGTSAGAHPKSRSGQDYATIAYRG